MDTSLTIKLRHIMHMVAVDWDHGLEGHIYRMGGADNKCDLKLAGPLPMCLQSKYTTNSDSNLGKTFRHTSITFSSLTTQLGYYSSYFLTFDRNEKNCYNFIR